MEDLTERNIAWERRRLFLLLLVYCIGVGIYRHLMPGARYLGMLELSSARSDLIARLPYYLMPFLGLSWLLAGRFGRGGLFFVAGMALGGIFDHGGYALFAASLLSLGIPHWGTLLIRLAFTILSLMIFRQAKRLYSGIPREESSRNLRVLFALLMLLFCYISPFIRYKETIKDLKAFFSFYPTLVPSYTGSDIVYMSASSDGKLLAVGSKTDISVWDVETRQCVWSDDKINVQRARFSESHKYLAVAGKSIPEGRSTLVIWKTDGFKRLFETDWSEGNVSRDKFVYDLVFRENEQSLLIAWSEDRSEDRVTREDYERLGEVIYQVDLFCTEVFPGDGGRNEKKVAMLNKEIDLLPEGSVYFSSDASKMFHFNSALRKEGAVVKEGDMFTLVDTRTWTQENTFLDRYFIEIGVGGVIRLKTRWLGWKFTRSAENAYFMGRGRSIIPSGGWWQNAFALVKIDLSTKEMTVMAHSPLKSLDAWIRLALSPDEKQAALLCFGETHYDYGGSARGEIAAIRIVDLKTKESRVLVYKNRHTGSGGLAWRLEWVSDKVIAAAPAKGNFFFFIDIGEGMK